MVAQFQGGFASPGVYQFPFAFNLHPSLPSSVVVSGHDHAALFYGVEVQLHRPNVFKHDLAHRCNFDVIANIPHAITPEMTRDVQEVNCCCCCGQGTVALGAHLQRNAFSANEIVVVVVEINNQSSTEVSRITVQLIEHTRFYAEGHGAHKCYTLAEATLPMVPAGSGFGSFNGTNPQIVQLHLPLQFPHCSMRSRLMQVEHMVEIKAHTGFGMNNPCINLPVTLHRSPLIALASAPMPHPADGDVPHAPPIPYSPDAAALHSPVQLDVAPSAPALPSIMQEQAMQAAPGVQMQPGMDARTMAVQQAPMQQPLMGGFSPSQDFQAGQGGQGCQQQQAFNHGYQQQQVMGGFSPSQDFQSSQGGQEYQQQQAFQGMQPRGV
jgi:hypothetical protein